MKRKKKKNNGKIFFIFIFILLLLCVGIKLTVGKIDLNEQDKQTAENAIEDKEEIKENAELNKDSDKIQKKTLLQEKLENGKYLSENGLPVLMYHFFYDKSKGESAKDGNWIEVSDFEEQIKYLSENDYYYPTWQEVEDYIDAKQELPEKSVVITVDDGDPSFFNLAVPILQKYNAEATSFVITSWYGDVANNKQKNVSYQSHSHDMHKAGTGGKGVMMSWDYNKIKEDLEVSSNILGGANIFCYPFGQYNDLDIRVLKDTGYKLSFTTKAGKVKKGTSKYELPRVRVSGNTSLSSFIKNL